MENLLEHTHLSDRSKTLFLQVLENYSEVFRERELHWQLKMLSRYVADREFFESCLTQKASDVKNLLPHVAISLVPPARSTPLRLWVPAEGGWPNAPSMLTQIFLQQILSSSDLFLDLGSTADAFFVLPSRDMVNWVPDCRGARWHEPFRKELARFYLGWAFEQERLMDTALATLHLSPLKDQLLTVLEHWHQHQRRSPELRFRVIKEVFRRAYELGVHVHPNLIIWMIYELEFQDVMASLELHPDIEQSADELCRVQCQMSA